MASYRVLLRGDGGPDSPAAELAVDLERCGHRIVRGGADHADVVDAVLAPAPVSDRLDEMEAAHIADVLARHGGNRRQAALALGVARSTLLAKIRRYRL